MTTASLGAQLVEQFDRMVRRDGGQVTLLGVTDDQIRVGYRPGSAGPDCSDDVCVLPQHELRQLMQETLSRRSPGTSLVVEVLHD
jgi:Fe-S cluster biogenesis protein NfuA